MSRLGAFWIGMAIVTGVANYGIKQAVQGTANELAGVQRKTIAEQKEIHELQADWTFLNQPELLADLNKRYVGLVAASPKQIGALIDTIPMRPAPPTPDLAPQIAALDPPEAAPDAQVTPLDPPMPATALQAVFAAPSPVAARAAASSPIVRASAPVPTPAPAVRLAASVTSRPAAPASLDALFAQVAGDR